MFGRTDVVSLVERMKNPKTGEFSSNFKLMSIAAAFLGVTIGLILLQPGYSVEQMSQKSTFTQDLATAPSAATLNASPLSETVTRLDNSTLFSVNPNRQDGAFRAPIRLTEGKLRTNDLQGLVATILIDFGHVSRQGDQLQKLLVEALAERQSDAYIDSFLNTAAINGKFVVPVALQTLSGRLDTPTLLQAIRSRARLN